MLAVRYASLLMFDASRQRRYAAAALPPPMSLRHAARNMPPLFCRHMLRQPNAVFDMISWR